MYGERCRRLSSGRCRLVRDPRPYSYASPRGHRWATTSRCKSIRHAASSRSKTLRNSSGSSFVLGIPCTLIRLCHVARSYVGLSTGRSLRLLGHLLQLGVMRLLLLLHGRFVRGLLV